MNGSERIFLCVAKFFEQKYNLCFVSSSSSLFLSVVVDAVAAVAGSVSQCVRDNGS